MGEKEPAHRRSQGRWMCEMAEAVAAAAAAPAAAVKEKTPTTPNSQTAPNVRQRRLNQTAEPKESSLPHPPL
jgi:hypothetical protein